MEIKINRSMLEITSKSGNQYHILKCFENRAVLTTKEGYPVISFFSGTASAILDDYLGVDFTESNGKLLLTVTEDNSVMEEDNIFRIYRANTEGIWEEQYDGRWVPGLGEIS